MMLPTEYVENTEPTGKAPAPEFVLIDELKLPKEVEEKICRQNAERLFWNAEKQ